MVNSKAKLFFAIMFSDRETCNKCIKDLIKKFGQIEKESFEYDFDKYTNYYEKEMGKNLIKKIIIFKKEISEKDLIEVKKLTTDIERTYSINNKRKINIDPGYINNKEVILASFKGKDFKENLGDGIFLHEVLEFKEGKTKSFFHTFPDYKSEEIQEFFLELIKQDL